jgi:hypothetical protein
MMEILVTWINFTYSSRSSKQDLNKKTKSLRLGISEYEKVT